MRITLRSRYRGYQTQRVNFGPELPKRRSFWPFFDQCTKVPKSTYRNKYKNVQKYRKVTNYQKISKYQTPKISRKYQYKKSIKVPKNQSNNATTRYLYGLDFGQAPVQNRAHISSVTMQQCTKIPK